MSSTGIPSIQGSDSKTSMAAVTATTPPRTRLWPVAAASGVILAGQVMVYWGILKTTLLNEQIAMLFLGCAGAGAAIVGMVVEQIKPEIMAMPLIKGLLGVSVFLSGLATMLTIVFGLD